MAILYGLLSAIGYGSGDFFARMSSRRIGAVYTLYYMQFIGLVALGIYLIASGELSSTWATTETGIWIAAFVIAGFNMTGSIAVYRGLEVGKASIVAPIVSSYSALIVVIALFNGEQIALVPGIGLGLVILGVVLSSIERSTGMDEPTTGTPRTRRLVIPAGVGWAMLSSVAFAIAFSAYGFIVTPVLGGIIPVWISRLTTITVLTFVFTLGRRGFRRPPDRGTWLYLLAVGIMDTIGFVALAIGVSGDQVAVVSVISSLFAAVTVLMARVFLHETLRPVQWAGIGSIFIGLVLVGALV